MLKINPMTMECIIYNRISILHHHRITGQIIMEFDLEKSRNGLGCWISSITTKRT